MVAELALPHGALIDGSKPFAYFKRFRMELDLVSAPEAPTLPAGHAWVAWRPDLLDWHAEVKFRSFVGTIDALVFPNLGHRDGCRFLMQEIAGRSGFRPEATWLVVGPEGPCATVQGVRDRAGQGAIQNLGVVPGSRGLGLGSALLLQAVAGFRRAGLGRCSLEVTSRNEGALRMYRRLGFRCRKTLYKMADPVFFEEPTDALAWL